MASALLARGAPSRAALLLVLVIAALAAGAGAAFRSTEYDETYTRLVTSPEPRPGWPEVPFTPAEAAPVLEAVVGPARISAQLRETDVHPPLYFWLAGAWRAAGGTSVEALRALSVLLAVGAVAAFMAAAAAAGLPAVATGLATALAYGFAYTGGVARGFALAQLLLGLGTLAVVLAWRRADRRAGERAEGRAGERAEGRAGERAEGHAGERAEGRAGERAEGRAGERAEGRAGERDEGRAGERAGGRAESHAGPRGAGPGGAALGLAAAGGLAAGLASFSNYLAAFPAAAVLGWLLIAPLALRARLGLLAAAALPFLVVQAGNLSFFLAQKASRPDQFEPFSLSGALRLLAQFNAANLFGGLPLYAEGAARAALALALVGLLGAVALAVAWRWRAIGPTRWLWLGAFAAPSAGLLLLGAVFGNTPVELRYLAFAAPFAAALLAGAAAGWGARAPRLAGLGLGLVLGVQAAGAAGMALHPATQQTYRDALAAVAPLLGPGTLLLVPRGNDGVGIVGAVLAEAPPDQPLLLLRGGGAPDPAPLAHAAGRQRLVLLAITDRDGARQAEAARAALAADPAWRAAGVPWRDARRGFRAEVFEPAGAGGPPVAALPR